VARRHDDEHDSLIAGRCSDTAEVVDGREVNKHRLFTSAYGRKRYPMSEVASYPRSSEKADLKRSVVVDCVLSEKSDESESDARAYSCKLSSDKLKSACVCKKSGNIKPALCSKGDNDSDESVVAKQEYSDKVCVTRVYDESDNGTDKRPRLSLLI